jgi:hypothetical protein
MKGFILEVLIPGLLLGAMTVGLMYLALNDRCEEVPEIGYTK